MTIAYSNFKGVTGKHGPSVTRRMAMVIKLSIAKASRHNHRRVAKASRRRSLPKHSPRRNWSRHYGYAYGRFHKGR